MFSSFSRPSQPPRDRNVRVAEEETNNTGNPPVTHSPSQIPAEMLDGASASPPRKPKRHQVSRACDSCRLHRIKCDDQVPCKNCLHRGEKCSNKSSGERRTLPQAIREIDRLKQKVKELEAELKKKKEHSSSITTYSPDSKALCCMLTPQTSSDSSSVADVGVSARPPPQRVWEGVYTSTAQSPQKTWYGPSSVFYYISRMDAYLASVFQQLHPDDQIRLKPVTKSFVAPGWNPAEDGDSDKLPRLGAVEEDDGGLPTLANDYLSHMQEEYFLGLFWQSFHTVLVVMNEKEFKEHYRSLLTKPGKPRRPSALVDIVIAMSMQIGTAITSRNRINSRTSLASSSWGTVVDVAEKDDATVAGRTYYRRCQRLLASEQEAPTLMTVQCHILSGIYLCCASFQNMSHIALGMAVRTAQMLGLHTEPTEDMSLATREMRKRLWWTLYTAECKASVKLGRPPAVEICTISCSLPADDPGAASVAGSDFAYVDESTTWLTFTLHNAKLVLATRAVHTALYDKYHEISATSNTGERGVIYDDTAAVERYAEFLASIVTKLDAWVQSVPEALKTQRRGDGVALSTDRSPLSVEVFAPLWLQRQRLVLELLYHNLRMNLCRPFIVFPSVRNATATATASTPTTRSVAAQSAAHGMAITYIMHQILTEMDILHGWHECFQWQWNAAVTLAGYLFAYPDDEGTAAVVRSSLDLAIEVFEIFSRSYAAANNAGVVIRDLAMKADFVTELSRPGGSGPGPGPGPPADGGLSTNPPIDPNIRDVLVAGMSGDIPLRRGDITNGNAMMALSVDGTNTNTATATASSSSLPNAIMAGGGSNSNSNNNNIMLGTGSMDMAYQVERFNDMEMLWPSIGNMPNEWWYDFSQTPKGGMTNAGGEMGGVVAGDADGSGDLTMRADETFAG